MPTMVGVPDLDGVPVGSVYVTCSVGGLLLSPGIHIQVCPGLWVGCRSYEYSFNQSSIHKIAVNYKISLFSN